MNRKMMADLAFATALKIDQYVISSSINPPGMLTILRYVEGEAGEDPIIDEHLHTIIPGPIMLDRIREALQEAGVPDERWDSHVDDQQKRTGIAEYPLLLWKIRIEFKAVPVFGSEEIVTKCKKLAAGNEWKKGIKVHRGSRSKLYEPGQEVRPCNVDKSSKFKWWFVTSYRAPSHMGMFRLLRSDGVLTSTSKVTIVEED